jgi:hypothetical protein
VPVTTDNTTFATTVVEGALRSNINMHFTKVSVINAGTIAWPANLTEVLTLTNVEEIISTYIDYFAPLIAAGSGAVSILPDYIGNGASVNTHNRTYGDPPTYMQAAVTSWMATKQAIEQDTYGWSINDGNGGCTVMDSVVSVAGVSEGGYAAISIAPAMQQVGVRVLSINAGATTLDPGEQVEFIVESFDTGIITMATVSRIYYYILPYIACVLSTNPGLANFGTDQLALAPEWRNSSNFDRDIISWLESPGLLTSGEIAQRMLPISVPSILNADYLGLLRQARAAGVSYACGSEFVVEGATDKICEAINSASLLDYVANIDIPLQLCYSPDDTVISAAVYSDAAINVFGNPNVTPYPGPLGLLPVTGDHLAAVALCSVAPLERFLDVESADRPNLISPLMADQAAMCALSKAETVTVPSSAPTEMPPSGASLKFSRVATSSGIALAVALLSWSMF